jgi:hypothetical protein
VPAAVEVGVEAGVVAVGQEVGTLPFAEHLTAEYRVKTEGRGRKVDEWKLRPQRSDNHWLDCLVGCAVAASIQGCVLFGTDVKPTERRERVSFAAMQRRKQR